jgi:hypothetical protein
MKKYKIIFLLIAVILAIAIMAVTRDSFRWLSGTRPMDYWQKTGGKFIS